jgi:hypothetical protein
MWSLIHQCTNLKRQIIYLILAIILHIIYHDFKSIIGYSNQYCFSKYSFGSGDSTLTFCGAWQKK